ncbi:replicative helicase loader/inhibitor [Paenibacillus sp. FSL W8-0919]|uniref:replicative helicase loader/inhibitor n=1 Tax=Paenibacillus sp. FSL W8-0919 TaxID=2954707 RepID=UPI0030FB9199
MNRAEVIDLFIEIKQEYPYFNDSDDEVDRHYKYLKDFPFEAALRNVEQHIKTSKRPPGISEIRGSLGEQIERDRMKSYTQEYFTERARAKQEACPPPPGWKESIYAKLGRA